MDINKQIEEYKALINNADALFDLQQGVTKARGQGYDYPFLIESIEYNGYNDVDRFKVKLQSLATLIKYELRLHYNLKHNGLQVYGNTIFDDIDFLRYNFYNFGDYISHKNFKLSTTKTTENLVGTHALFTGFIDAAYQSLMDLLDNSNYYKTNNLNRSPKDELLEILPFSQNIKDEVLKHIDTILFDVGITNSEGKSILRTRKKLILWVLIDLLKEKKVINLNLTEAVYITVFWNYIDGQGNPPVKPHRENTNSYNKQKVIIKDKFPPYFEKLTTINDKLNKS